MMSAVYLVTRRNLLSSALERGLREHFSVYTLSPERLGKHASCLSEHIVLIDVKALGSEEFHSSLEKMAEGAPHATVAVINADNEQCEPLVYRYLNIKGIFSLDDSLDTLVKGVRELDRGVYWLSRKQMSYLLESFRMRQTNHDKHFDKNLALIEELTPRELEILQLVSTGASNISIADQICLSENTVKTHLSNLYRKLDINNRTQATLWVKNNMALLYRDVAKEGIKTCDASR